MNHLAGHTQRTGWHRARPALLSWLVALLALAGTGPAAAQAVAVTFHWSPPADGAPVDHYRVYRSLDGGPFYFMDVVTDTVYVLQAQPGHAYRLRVSGVSATGIEGEMSLPSDTVEPGESSQQLVAPPPVPQLRPNYPNPFNPQTTISYGIPDRDGGARLARLEIYDVRGQRVRSLPAATDPGWHTVIWDGTADDGTVMPSGRYIVRLWSDGGSDSWTMTMVK